MAQNDAGDELTFEKGFQELAQRIMEADGIVPLEPGEIRPPGYYLVGYFSRGRKPFPPRAKRTKR